MTIREAHRLLETEEGEPYHIVRKKYLQFMKESHPDNRYSHPHKDARLLNEAYHLIINSMENTFHEKAEEWDAEVISNAFCDRVIYYQHVFDDGIIHQIPMAKGKYLWNPDAEEFAMLLRSVYEAAHGIAGKEDPAVFHYLMQEFIDPVYALDHIPEPWHFRCRGISRALSDRRVRYSNSRLYVVVSGGAREIISFSEKSLNYVVAPLIQSGSAVAEADNSGRIRLELTGKPFTRDYNGMNARIRERIIER